MENLDFLWDYISSAVFTDILDVLIVAFLMYKLATLIRHTSAGRLVKGVVILVVATQVSAWANFHTINFVLDMTMTVGLTAIVVVFQPELRKMLEQMGKGGFSGFSDKSHLRDGSGISFISEIVSAAEDLSETKTGMLVVVQRVDNLDDRINSGVFLDSQITSDLLKNIFYPKAPLHDGAVCIVDFRIKVAGCVLPLSANQRLSKDLGTRHRAAVGISEVTDCICIVVSEETGSISVAIDGMLKRHLSANTLEKILKNELTRPEETTKKGFFSKIRGKN